MAFYKILPGNILIIVFCNSRNSKIFEIIDVSYNYCIFGPRVGRHFWGRIWKKLKVCSIFLKWYLDTKC